MTPSGWQTYEGRRLIGMSQDDLARSAGVGLTVVVRAEMIAYTPMLTSRDSADIQAALEAMGIEFIQQNGEVGVRLRKGEVS